MSRSLPATLSDPGLWARLDAFTIGPAGAALDFTTRLARENGWPLAYARQVVQEYKRFVYLCCTGAGPMTPSDAVDQAWHLHLAYTRSYWDELCGEVIGRPLHHGPTKGGAVEADRFERQYQATLDRYEAEFGTAPEPRVWPPVRERFGPARFERVDRLAHWVIPRRAVRHGLRNLGLGAGVIGLVAACSLPNPFDPEFQITDLSNLQIVLLALVIGIPLALYIQWRFLNQKPRRGGRWSGCGGSGGCSGGGDGGSGDSGCGGGGCGGGCGA